MIIRTPQDVTEAALSELTRIEDPRLRELLTAAVRHLHQFVRDTQLTESEFPQICGVVAELGRLTTASHNEVVLIAGSLGLSSLVCLLNNGQAAGETTANLLGPFWRSDSPRMRSGDSILRGDSTGVPIFVDAWVRDSSGRPVAGAEVEVWHTSSEGFYENQDPGQADMNLRGTFITDDDGHIAFRSVKPAGYPIPVNGPVGALLRAQGRHNMRPAHIHFLIYKPGYKTQFSQVYSGDDPHLQTDVQFAVTSALVGEYVLHEEGKPPADDVAGPWYTLRHKFVIEPGEARRPRPPITGKTQGPRPQLQVLQRRA